MKMAPAKCNYTVFSRRNGCRNEFGLSLFGGRIPYEKNPVSLGITFNESLSFESQVKKMKANCVQRLNIIKILSHKSWKLSSQTLISIYKSLIRSVIDYSAFLEPRLTPALKTLVQAIQNKAIRIIYHLPREESTVDLCGISGLELVETRMKELNTRYYQSAVSNNNELICDLFGVYWSHFGNREVKTPTLLCSQIAAFRP
jgi:hypothetical protein